MGGTRAELPEAPSDADAESVDKQNATSAEGLPAIYEAALNMIDAGTFGDPASARFRISASGHSNPGRDNTGTGYVKDYVSLTVSQL